MLTDRQIQNLVTRPKRILRRVPPSGYQEEGRQRRGELELEATDDSSYRFSVFIRQSAKFIENFSVGLRYQTGDSSLGTVTLLRYNGPHGESVRDPDGHYARPHIHRITEAALVSGSEHPQEMDREITDQYATLEEALVLFLNEVGVMRVRDNFDQLVQMRFFSGHG